MLYMYKKSMSWNKGFELYMVYNKCVNHFTVFSNKVPEFKLLLDWHCNNAIAFRFHYDENGVQTDFFFRDKCFLFEES